MRIDLHSHTTVSDGKLTPDELINLATATDLDMLAITDHDSIDAFDRIPDLVGLPFRLIPGIEFSTQWLKIDIHILGLNVNLDSDALHAGITRQHALRQERAGLIAEKLSRELGIDNMLADIRKLANSDHNIGRPHFARYLIDTGVVKDEKEAFKKYLGIGKKAYIKPTWAELPEIVGWIRAAGGTAVIAHPARYKLTRTRLMRLVESFIEAGGEGLEVISGNQTPDVTNDLARICEKKGMLASCGSDFHGHEQLWSKLGHCAAIPQNCEPVWSRWG